MTKGSDLRRTLETSARDILFGSRSFSAVRDAYQFVFDREKRAFRQQVLRFYRSFISRNDLVFDIGANVGEYSDTFLALGARVVAIEPNPAGCKRLKILEKRGSLFVEECAVGDAEGSSSMRICSDPGLSTLSNEWYQTARTAAEHKDLIWSDAINVRISTLDSLALKYGTPAFIKVDVEGFEDRVLAGMSFRPQAISFEFHPTLMNIVRSCLRNPVLHETYRFNYTVGMSHSFELKEWVGARDLENILTQARFEEEFGDIFCRRNHRSHAVSN
jgi:FkbM family methyltransferase